MGVIRFKRVKFVSVITVCYKQRFVNYKGSIAVCFAERGTTDFIESDLLFPC